MPTYGMYGEGVPDDMNLLTFKASAVMATVGIAVKADSGTGDGYVTIAGDGEEALGILMTASAAVGDPVRVCMAGGPVIGVAGAGITYGEKVNACDAYGRLDTAGATEFAIGIALATATAANDQIPIFVHKHRTS